jgi:hypothetical protein
VGIADRKVNWSRRSGNGVGVLDLAEDRLRVVDGARAVLEEAIDPGLTADLALAGEHVDLAVAVEVAEVERQRWIAEPREHVVDELEVAGTVVVVEVVVGGVVVVVVVVVVIVVVVVGAAVVVSANVITCVLVIAVVVALVPAHPASEMHSRAESKTMMVCFMVLSPFTIIYQKLFCHFVFLSQPLFIM